MSQESYAYGGQALIEGVMMRGKKHLAIAVRQPKSEEILLKVDGISSVSQKYPFLKTPFIRGSVALVESMVLGMRALTYSANIAAEEEDEKITPTEMAGTVALAIFLAVGLFFILPVGLAHLLNKVVVTHYWQNLLEGVIRVGIFLAYVIGISILPDIQRVFMYHGAEHKTIHAYENKEELTVENIKKYTNLHPRCGTNFLLTVMVISVIVFSFLGEQTLLWRVVSRVILIPVVAGISFEFIKFSGPRCHLGWVKVINTPGLWLQKLTTREPDDQQIEVAIAALKVLLENEKLEKTSQI